MVVNLLKKYICLLYGWINFKEVENNFHIITQLRYKYENIYHTLLIPFGNLKLIEIKHHELN